MGDDNRGHVEEAMKVLIPAVGQLPPSASADVVRDATARLEAALRGLGFELGRIGSAAWMRP